MSSKLLKKIKQNKIRLEILQHPNEVLRAENIAVGDVHSLGLRDLIDQMVYTIRQVNGMGLAAPQIGRNIKLAVAIVGRQPVAMFNPVIVEESDEKISIDEGCLSCSGKTVHVKRSASIILEYDNISGRKCRVGASGIDSIVIQHEIDHLNGKLIVDYE